MKLIAILLVLSATAGCSARDTRATVQPPPGCYHFDSPLGPSARGYAERDDSAWYEATLLTNGKVERPGLTRATERELWASRSTWSARGDTLAIRLSTGLMGWDLTLFRGTDAYIGTARYLSDALGGPPVIVPVRAIRVSCSAERLPNER